MLHQRNFDSNLEWHCHRIISRRSFEPSCVSNHRLIHNHLDSYNPQILFDIVLNLVIRSLQKNDEKLCQNILQNRFFINWQHCCCNSSGNSPWTKPCLTFRQLQQNCRALISCLDTRCSYCCRLRHNYCNIHQRIPQFQKRRSYLKESIITKIDINCRF